MAKVIQLELVYSGGTLTFNVEGEWLPRWEPVHKLNANPPVVVEMRKVWEFRQAKLIASTAAALWTAIGTLETALDARGTGHFTAARLVRVGSPNVTLIDLSATTYEQFLVEALEGETDALAPAASWRTSAAFTIRVSAVKKNAEAVTGLVGFDQQVSYSYERGLAIIEQRTQVTTKEGTSAVTKAQTYAPLTVANFGSDYSYDTNSSSGVDYDYTDADEANSRTPTVCSAVSRIRQWGINVGTTGPGSWPDKVGYSTRATVTTKKTRTEIVISAEGPNALAWVLARKPAGALTEDELFHDTANRIVIWTGAQEEEDEKQKQAGRRGEIKVTISGGYPARDFEPVPNGYEPVEFEGAFLPWEAVVEISVERIGGSGLLSELKLPGKPGAPWVLMENESTEGEPYLVEEDRKVDETQETWTRTARLVYRSARPPSDSVAKAIGAAVPVASHLYPHAS